jgi:hypothetical protein
VLFNGLARSFFMDVSVITTRSRSIGSLRLCDSLQSHDAVVYFGSFTVNGALTSVDSLSVLGALASDGSFRCIGYSESMIRSLRMVLSWTATHFRFLVLFGRTVRSHSLELFYLMTHLNLTVLSSLLVHFGLLTLSPCAVHSSYTELFNHVIHSCSSRCSLIFRFIPDFWCT